MTTELPPLRDVIVRFDLNSRKKFGQHFLLDLNLTEKIARVAGNLSACTVVEIGPGPGGLTRALLDSGAQQVIAIERDPRCVEAIKELAGHYDGRLKVIDANALDFNLSDICQGPN